MWGWCLQYGEMWTFLPKSKRTKRRWNKQWMAWNILRGIMRWLRPNTHRELMTGLPCGSLEGWLMSGGFILKKNWKITRKKLTLRVGSELGIRQRPSICLNGSGSSRSRKITESSISKITASKTRPDLSSSSCTQCAQKSMQFHVCS